MRFAFLVAAFLVGCSSGPSASECEQALQHLVDLELAKSTADRELSDEMKASLAQQKRDIVVALQTSARETCQKKAPRELVQCLTNAKTLDDAKACDVK